MRNNDIFFAISCLVNVYIPMSGLQPSQYAIELFPGLAAWAELYQHFVPQSIQLNLYVIFFFDQFIIHNHSPYFKYPTLICNRN